MRNIFSATFIAGPRSLPWIASLIFVLGCIVYGPSPQSKPLYSNLIEGAEMPHVALGLVQHGTFSDPFYARPTGPTAHTPPVYVFLYAAVAKLFGIGMAGVWVLTALNVVFVALQLALLPVLSDRLGLGMAPGALAAILGLGIQPYRVLVGWESLLMWALLVTLCTLTWSHFKMPGAWWRSLSLGGLWGVAILTNPECVLLLFAWAHIAAMENEAEVLSRARRAMLVALAGAALVCLPWFLRNFEQFHSVFFVRDNFGLELYTSNNPCARPTMLQNFLSGCHVMTHPNGNPFIATDVANQGEIGFNREMLRNALSWIALNPRKFGWLTGRRFLRYWFPSLGSFRYSIPMGILTVLSLAGLAWMYREHRQAALLLASTLCVYPLVHYLVQFEARYRYPIFWATLLPASYAIVKIIPKSRKSAENDAPAAREAKELTPA
jgi:hypothetical protein